MGTEHEPPTLRPQSRGLRWLHRTIVVVMGLVALTSVPDATAGLPTGRLALWVLALLVVTASVAATWVLSGRWPSRPANPALLRGSAWRARRTARRDLLAGRPLDDRGRREVTLGVVRWSENVAQLPMLGAVVGAQIAVQAATLDGWPWFFVGIAVVAVLWSAAVLGFGIPLYRAAGRAGLLPEVRETPA